jgi:hypothetical protein
MFIDSVFPSVEWYSNRIEENSFGINPNENTPHSVHHYQIATAQGPQTLIIPLVKDTKNQPWAYRKISYQHKWIKEHQNALQTAYGKSPFFEFYDYKIFHVWKNEPENLGELFIQTAQIIHPYLGLDHLKLDWSESEIKEKQEKTSPENKKIYPQVFSDVIGFLPHMSIIDLLFNLGPEAPEHWI